MLHGRLLRYLDEIARCGSIRKASDRLNVAASAINRQLIELEEELGTPLFERLSSGLRLTTAGEMLIAHVRDTLREHDRTLSGITALKGLMRGEVVIVTVPGLAAGVLGDALALFRHAYPRVTLTVRVLPREDLVDAVLSGQADLGFAYNLAQNPRLARVASFEYRLGAVVAPSHPLSNRKAVRLSDCLGFPLVVAETGMTLRTVLDLMVPPNVEFVPVVETNLVRVDETVCARPAARRIPQHGRCRSRTTRWFVDIRPALRHWW